ncbi:hypothetical protein EV589_0330 [Mycobacterium sp. BK558]|jgi:hypothetical protein|uniref:Transmembrane protein n=2 Tax=Mycolicibacterium TaxID=1866885 RepID=A0A0J6VT86_MYCCU|nr:MULTISPECIES: hypothetical protein [Mycolicibacterium]MBI5341620.1 hypothetical protein [Mycolicibacterium rufum]RZT24617.1 hypothetical protein EV589_0330 [Mycobacterium sp. BK558]KMO70504.1 hypothetical protein MCHLDSM_05392 [Mycolicibacterium chlorophenolicum]KMO73394.1 hypothetical protein MCHUDSM44219_04572 [Mycolicibacterium chubuense]ORA56627.1 hypothetical protein BST22_01465 [Mycolicibacterium chubuense]
MMVAAMLCLGVAAVTAALGVWSLTRPVSDDFVRQVLRGVAPTQLAAAVMLAAGAVVGLSAPRPTSTVVLLVCIGGALATVAAGCWQSAKVVARANARVAAGADSCAGACASCTLSCDR